MTDNKNEEKEYCPPMGNETSHFLSLGAQGDMEYTALAEWILLRKKEKPVAEIFNVSYMKKGADSEKRPITFVFNGGPGASSAYLHVGALGPKRVLFSEDGTPLKPPVKVVDNTESWLNFTDLVFIDPVGTGFSRILEESDKKDFEGKDKKNTSTPVDEKEFYKLNRDIDSLGEFIQKFLSKHKRWSTPVFIAGESYGGFRVGKLARKLQEGFGVGLNGAILISPALEWILLNPTDYEVLHWIDTFPTMVLSAFQHGKCKALSSDSSLEEVKNSAEKFATEELSRYLIQGDSLGENAKADILKKISDFIGLKQEFIERASARIPIHVFVRELLRSQRVLCGLYDSTSTAIDPFPDRENHEGPDPTLYSIERVFAAGINTQLRNTLGINSSREYKLLSMDVNTSWKVDGEKHAFQRQVGATDDLRYAMSLNPHMKVYVTHGLFDLVTPYFSSNRLLENMKLTPSQKENITLKHFKGGHMFYAWDSSRIEFTKSMKEFFQSAM